MFNSPISLDYLPKAIFTESVSLIAKPMTTSKKPIYESAIPPPVLSPSIYSLFMQIKANNPSLSNDEAIRIAHTMELYGKHKMIKCEDSDSPIHMS